MRAVLIAAAVAWLSACATEPASGPAGRLSARPRKPTAAPRAAGETPLGIGDSRDGRLYVPAHLAPKVPVLLLLHGAGGAGERIIRRMRGLADEFGFIIVAPDSRGETWDAARGSIGVDVAFIDQVLRDVFARYPVDAAHVAVGGFSDGASYALTIGAINGDLFPQIIAFSPGYIATRYGYGHPAIFIAHGTADEILSFENTSNILVPGLRKNGYAVKFRTFDGPHTVPPDVAREAVEWWLK